MSIRKTVSSFCYIFLVRYSSGRGIGMEKMLYVNRHKGVAELRKPIGLKIRV